MEATKLAAECYGSELAKRYEVDNVHLKGESLSVMNAIAKKERGTAPIHALYDYVFNMSLDFDNFTYSFVRRRGNTVAHMIARWDTGSTQEKICMDPFPSSLFGFSGA